MHSKQNKQNKPISLSAVVFGVVVVALMVGITVLMLPFVQSLSDPVNQAEFRQWIDSMGILGVLVLLGIQILQIVVAVIPGEPIEVIAGVMYGAAGGLVICLIGILIGSALVFFAVRKLGKGLLVRIVGEEKLREYSFLHNTNRIELLTFILFFIPGTPKDILTYVAGVTDIRPMRFLLIATFARIPSVISSTLAGSHLGSGNIWISVAIFAVTGIIGLLGIYLNRRLMKRYQMPS